MRSNRIVVWSILSSLMWGGWSVALASVTQPVHHPRMAAGSDPALGMVMAKGESKAAPANLPQEDAISIIEKNEGVRYDENKRRMTSGQPMNGSPPATVRVGQPTMQPAYKIPGSDQFFRCRMENGRVVMRNFGCQEGEGVVNSIHNRMQQ